MSRIKIDPHEAEKLAREIAAVLTYASSLQNIAQAYKTALAITQGAAENVTREDVVVQQDAQVILKQASEREGDYFVVPLIIKQD